MDTDSLERGEGVAESGDHDRPRRLTVDLCVDAAAGRQQVADRLGRLVDRRRRRVERRTCAERGVDDLDHRGGVVVGRHRNDQISYRGVHQRQW